MTANRVEIGFTEAECNIISVSLEAARERKLIPPGKRKASENAQDKVDAALAQHRQLKRARSTGAR